jgi:hypothetical protein
MRHSARSDRTKSSTACSGAAISQDRQGSQVTPCVEPFAAQNAAALVPLAEVLASIRNIYIVVLALHRPQLSSSREAFDAD